MSRIWNMLKRSKMGIFFPESAQEIRRTIEKMGEMSSPAALIALLDILHRMSLVEQTSSLTTSTYNKKLDMLASQRIEQVYSYILKNLKRNPNLDTAAAKINMTKTSFCKFVKSKTKKTFSELVNDMRIAHAAKLLQNTDMTAPEVCYDSGFNDPSYFYRVFSKRTGLSPKEYRKQFGTTRQRKNVASESARDAKSNIAHLASRITPPAVPS